MFDVLQRHLATKGRLIIVGAISSHLKDNLHHPVKDDFLIKVILIF